MIPKFRGYIKSIEKIVDVTEIDLKNKMVTLDIATNEVMPEWSFWWKETVLSFESVELMQSTMLKDKNGVEIFEGDILENITQISYLGEKYKVVKNEKYANFILLDNKGLASNIPIFESETSYEVIGNIYENKELLED